WIFIGSILMYSKELKKITIPLVLFFFCSGLVYLVPHLGDIITFGHPFNQNIAQLWPGEQQTENEFYLHLYPDPYTYFYDREYFDEKMLAQMRDIPLLDRIQKYKILINFDVGSHNILTKIGNGIWLQFQMVPGLFHQENFGGAIIWIFIIPGMVFLWRNNRKLLIILSGTFLSSEFIIRFVMHYSRNHYMDIGWVFTLFAAIGLCIVANSLSKSGIFSKKTSMAVLSILLFIQLVQGNRILLSNQYRNTRTEALRLLSSSLEEIPQDAVVASGISASNAKQVAFLSNRTIALFAPETVEHLIEDNELLNAFKIYGVTHVIGYNNIITSEIQNQIPLIQIIHASGESVPVEVTTFQRFLIHLIR
ncbi:MAG: hypothetical protein KAS32_13395, partial [Candidatus Peribacteraceae bacterium]|nr:hypothetical protein [Candidatus Peribacteraceae bacterium]